MLRRENVLLDNDNPSEVRVAPRSSGGYASRGLSLCQRLCTCSRIRQLTPLGVSLMLLWFFMWPQLRESQQMKTYVCENYNRQEACDDEILSRGITSHGDRSRLLRFFQKAHSGGHLKVAVLGGSISAGAWVSKREIYSSVVVGWLESQFPFAYFELVNGAMGATGTQYFSQCYPRHIGDDADLVIVEFAINDRPADFSMDLSKGIVNSMEQLVRNLLSMPSNPAIVAMDFWHTNFAMRINAQLAHDAVFQFYGIPICSVMNAVLPDINGAARIDWNGFMAEDNWHPSARGHFLMGHIIIHLMNEVLDKAVATSYAAPPVPALPIGMTGVPEKHAHPRCYKDQEMDVLEATDWTLEQKNSGKQAWQTNTVGSVLSIRVEAVSSVDLFYVRSPSYGLGRAECWLDDQREDAVVFTGFWESPESVGVLGCVGTLPGHNSTTHIVHCALMEETDDPDGKREFQIRAVLTH